MRGTAKRCKSVQARNEKGERLCKKVARLNVLGLAEKRDDLRVGANTDEERRARDSRKHVYVSSGGVAVYATKMRFCNDFAAIERLSRRVTYSQEMSAD